MVSVSVEAFIKICVELPVLTFAVSLLICLVCQLIRKKEGFDTGFFRVFVVCVVGDCVCNYILCFVCHLPNTGAFSEFFNQQLLSPSTFLCTYIHAIAGFGSRVSFIGQMVIAANRFTAIYFPLKHQEIWKPQRTNLIICLNLFAGFLLQSPSIFTTGYYVAGYNCAYGMAFGTINVNE
uniref:Serpentine receptor class gamma n=1 Tax=Acrobeloides nanus TaxID=290746 RepID=A0A914CIW6_9BILA